MSTVRELLRALDSKGLRAALDGAHVCNGWSAFDDEGAPVHPDDYEGDEAWHEAVESLFLDTISEHHAAHVSDNGHWKVYRPGGGLPIAGQAVSAHEAVGIVEVEAVALGWHLPWLLNVATPEPMTPSELLAAADELEDAAVDRQLELEDRA